MRKRHSPNDPWPSGVTAVLGPDDLERRELGLDLGDVRQLCAPLLLGLGNHGVVVVHRLQGSGGRPLLGLGFVDREPWRRVLSFCGLLAVRERSEKVPNARLFGRCGR